MESKLFDFEDVCRICLNRKDETVSIFEEISIPELVSFKEMIQECASIQILIDDVLPKSLCIQCSKQLEQSYKLRLQCLLSEKIIRVVIEKSNIKSETEDDSNDVQMNLSSFELEKEKLANSDLKSDTDDYTTNDFFESDTDKLDNVSILVKEEVFDETINSNKLTLKCKFCNMKFSSKMEYIPHLEEIHFKTAYSCDKCEQIYYSPDGLKRHSLTHENRCRYCLELLENKSKLAQHMKEHVDKSEYPCGECDKVFQTKDTHRTHRKRNHNMKSFLCTYCGRSFRDYSNLQVHIRIHSGEKPYSCDICGAKFIQWYSLKSHSITHSKEKNYQCKICDKSYSRRNGLARHILTHSGEKNAVCNVCDKRFLDKKDLREHQKIHTGERKHICAFCEKAFLKNDNLKVHLRTHTGDRPYVCSRCGKGFAQKHVLNSHLRTHVESPE